MIFQLIPLPFLLWALYADAKTRKIYNGVTYPLIGIGLLVQLLLHGMAAFSGAAGAIFLFVFLSSMYKAMRVGGGDLKLILGCMMFLDLKTSGLFILWVFGISALLAMVQYGRKEGFSNLCSLLKLDLMTAGTAPQEAVHVLGALVILLAYVAVIIPAVLKGLI